MSRGSNKQAAIVGLFSVGGFIAFGLGVMLVGNLQSGVSRKVSVQTTFDDVNGLTRGAAVWFSGVPVGTVRELKLVAQDEVNVILGIDQEHAAIIPSDASAYVSSDSFIGNTIVVLSGGDAANAGLVEGSTLAADETLTAEQVISEVRTTNEQIQAIAADLKVVSGRLAEGTGTIGKLLAEDTLYTTLTDTTAELQRTADNATASTAQLSRFARGLNQEGTLAYQLSHDETTYPALVSSVESLQQTASNVSAATDDTDTPLGVLMQSESGADDLEGTLQNLEQSTALLNDTLGAVQESWWLRRLNKKKARRE